MMIRILQLVVALATGSLAIYYQESTGDKLNPYMVGAWCIMAAFAASYLLLTAIDIRSYGFAGAFPPWQTILSVSWKVVAVLFGLALALAILGGIESSFPDFVRKALHRWY